jgi:hypothetical protein
MNYPVSMNSDPARRLLRHTIATLAYRGAKALREAPDSFSGFQASEACRTPGEILAHIGDLLDWALSMAQGTQRWRDSVPVAWEEGARRFFTSLESLDAFLESNRTIAVSAEKLFQGPIADALTHVGQIAMLRRLAGVPIRGENYLMANIQAGRVGDEQAAPVQEFD